MNRLTAVITGSLILLFSLPPATADEQRWQLKISGHRSFLFGEGSLGGGLSIPWEVLIEFGVRDGAYQLGSGRARWLDEVVPLSYPTGWFSCTYVEGTYLDSNLSLHETPRVRFSAFPVAGRLEQGRIRLKPGYTSPGNYLAVTYECSTDNPNADDWFAFAERGKQVLGKRQDAETQREQGARSARVSEVASLPPSSALELPLQDGWSFSQGSPEGSSSARYRLRRLP